MILVSHKYELLIEIYSTFNDFVFAVRDLSLSKATLELDEFLNEYISPDSERLLWATDFSGSAGRAIVSQNSASLYVDGRYTFQAKEQVDTSQISLEHLNDFSKNLNNYFF